MLSTSSKGLSATITAKDPVVTQLRFKDIVSIHEHRQGKFEIFAPDDSLKELVYYRASPRSAQEKISKAAKFFPHKPIDKHFYVVGGHDIRKEEDTVEFRRNLFRISDFELRISLGTRHSSLVIPSPPALLILATTK